MNWTKVSNELPKVGVPVLLFANHVVQEDTYRLSDDTRDCREWVRDPGTVQEIVAPDHWWMYLPEGPESEK